MPITTPPPRLPQPRRAALCGGVLHGSNKENWTVLANSGGACATPTKTAPGDPIYSCHAVSERPVHNHPWGLEVKNTFIHYGSPVRTVSVVTPPKTVPSNFAPELVFLDKLRTPSIPAQANTPSTAGHAISSAAGVSVGVSMPSATAGLAVGSQPSCVMAIGTQPQPQGMPGTLLRLSDFLPSPAALASMGQLPPVQANNHSVSCCDPSAAAMPVSWQSFETSAAVQSLMPPVPPLPIGSISGGASPTSYGGIPGFGPSFDGSALGYQQPSEDASMPVVAVGTPSNACMPYDANSSLQFFPTGDTSMMGLGSAAAYATGPQQPQMPSGMGDPSPVAALGLDGTVSFQMGAPCGPSTQPAAGMACCGTAVAPAAPSLPPNVAGHCGFMQNDFAAAGRGRVSISVGHFPEPGMTTVGSSLPSCATQQLQPPVLQAQQAQPAQPQALQPQQQPLHSSALQSQPSTSTGLQRQSSSQQQPQSAVGKWRSSPSKAWRSKRGGHGY